MDCENANVEGVTNPDRGANRPPASPAHTAEMAKAAAFIVTGLSPTDSAAVSESLTARMARPSGLIVSFQYIHVARAASARPAMATPRSPMLTPKAVSGGTPMMPFCPPVRPRHSTAPCSTMKPKAMVIIAR